MYICVVYVRIYVCVLCVLTYVCVVCMRVYVCVRVRVCMYMCVCTCMCICEFYASLVATVKFSKTMYSVNRNAGPAQIRLVLSNPLSTDIIAEVFDVDGSATGEYCTILINY